MAMTMTIPPSWRTPRKLCGCIAFLILATAMICMLSWAGQDEPNRDLLYAAIGLYATGGVFAAVWHWYVTRARVLVRALVVVGRRPLVTIAHQRKFKAHRHRATATDDHR